MKVTRAQSAQPESAELTPAEQGMRERNLAHLLIIAHREGVPAAMEEWHRMLAEKRAKAQNSPAG